MRKITLLRSIPFLKDSSGKKNASRQKNKFAAALLSAGLSLMVMFQAQATNFVSNGTGNWNSTSSWLQGAVPGATDEVTIKEGHVITLTQNEACAKLTINGKTGNGNIGKVVVPNALNLDVNGDIIFAGAAPSNAYLEITGPGTLNIGGALDNDGTLNMNTASTIIFDGSVQQDIPVNLTFANVQFANTSPNGAILKGHLVNSGTLNPSRSIVTGNITITSGILNNSGKSITVGGTKNVFISENGTLRIPDTYPFSAYVPVMFTNSTIEYSGDVAQTIKNIPYKKLKLSGAGVKTLEANTTIESTIDLTNKQFNIDGFTLTIGSDATNISAAGGYFILGNTGKLIIKNIGSGGRTGQVLFPIGTASSYTPAYVTNAGTVNDFSVTVSDGIKNYANTTVTNNVVKKTWHVFNETNLGTSDVTLKLQWNEATDQGSSFNVASCGINHFTNNSWDQPLTYTSAAVESGIAPNRVLSATRTGISSFSDFGVGDANNPLPVELVYFKAIKQGESALLEWETATEKNNQGFEIQLSSDGKMFERIGFVASCNPNSQTSQRYTFTDPQRNKTGLWYYRIKQTDLDGTVSFYGPKVVDFGKALNEIAAYPNPFSDQFQLKLQTVSDSEASITICDLTGKTVYFATEKVKAGSNQILVKIKEQVKPGLYLLTVRTSDKVYSSRLVKE